MRWFFEHPKRTCQLIGKNIISILLPKSAYLDLWVTTKQCPAEYYHALHSIPFFSCLPAAYIPFDLYTNYNKIREVTNYLFLKETYFCR